MNSPIPWCLATDGSGAIIKDASGETIGFFKDYLDGDYVINMQQAIKDLEEELEELELKEKAK